MYLHFEYFLSDMSRQGETDLPKSLDLKEAELLANFEP